MKLKNIFAALVATLAIATGCQKEIFVHELTGLKVESSILSIPMSGGSVTLNFEASADWSFDNVVPGKGDAMLQLPTWLKASATSGSAGNCSVTFSAESTYDGRTANLAIKCGNETQYIDVMQGVATVSSATCQEVIAGPESKTYRVKGIVTNIVNTTYGNWYLKDATGEVYIYGTLDAKGGAKNFLSLGLEEGDEVTVEGPKTVYNGVVELVDVTVVQISKSLIKVDSLTINNAKIDTVPIEGATVVANLTCKGKGISVNVLDDAKSWLSISGINTNDGTVSFEVAPNKGGDRSTTLTFLTTDGKKEYSSKAVLSQKGAIIKATIKEYLDAAEDDTQYRISGRVTQIKQDSDKYGANLYIADYSGEVYIYGTTNAEGKVTTFKSMNIKEGDIVEFVGKRSSYKGTPQMSKGSVQWSKAVTPMTAAEAAALEDDDKNDPKNYVELTGVVTTATDGNKTDLKNYGNFDLVDESGKIYVYGVSTGWNGQTKMFSTLGVNEGDTITIVAYKTSYKGKPQVVGMYCNHTSAK